MSGSSIVAWIALVVVYVAVGRYRGSTWRAIVGMPALILATVLVEFAVPAMLARRGDAWILVVPATAFALLGLWVGLRPTAFDSRGW